MDQIIFGSNYFWTKLYTIENFGFWIKLFFGPNEPYRILDQIILGPNYFGPNYTRIIHVNMKIESVRFEPVKSVYEAAMLTTGLAR